MRPLVAVDWGTSSLRAALLGEDGKVLEEYASARGILTVEPGGFAPLLIAANAQWMRSAGTFYLLCGMVGSRQGWLEAPYCPCPAGFAEIASQLAWVELDRIAIVPGMSCEDHGVPDVMRGEETQVFGAMDLLGLEGGLFVLPGTHSKWVRAAGGRIERFSTFMTGEFYALLRQHSILGRTMPQDDGELHEGAFRQGLDHARRSANLLHAAFSARTLALFGRMPEAALPSYLSGLAIGEELRSQQLDAGRQVVIIGSSALTLRYELALAERGITSRRVGSEATWRGLWAIARTLQGQQA
ncbi:MAG: 2-dehydro-3-deoxygalactonokinase [Burkholderiales bacterium]|nr:2-dehydro-3-deoxygalactonokinase [Burkholderiales bacterium]